MIAVVYTRFSPRPNAQECESCDKQEERCVEYCLCKWGVQPVHRFRDENVSGGVLDRPGLNMAIESLRGNGDNVLVADSMSRIGRDMLVILSIQHEVEKAGGRIEFADGSPVSTTPEGELFSNILAAFAAYERSKIKHATSRGLKRRQANGEWFGKPPAGYMLDPDDSKKLVECPEERLLIDRIMELAECGYRSTDSAGFLHSKGYSFRGKPWSARTIRKIIQRIRAEEA